MTNKKILRSISFIALLALAVTTFCSCSSEPSPILPSGDFDPSFLYESEADYQFDGIEERPFTVVDSNNKTSTFSLDRSTVSYALMRSQINKGLTIDPASVRIEEYINYFNYSYPSPESNKALSISGITKRISADAYTDKADEDQAFIACVAEFGLLLHKSDYKSSASFDDLVERLDALDCTRSDEFKAGFSALIKKAYENLSNE